MSKPGDFPLFSGKVQIVSRTLLGLFLVGAVNKPRKRKRTNRENAGKMGNVPNPVLLFLDFFEIPWLILSKEFPGLFVFFSVVFPKFAWVQQGTKLLG